MAERWIRIQTDNNYVVDEADMSVDGLCRGIGNGCAGFAANALSIGLGIENMLMIVDAYGERRELPKNEIASRLFNGLRGSEVIVGNVLLVKTAEDEKYQQRLAALTAAEAQEAFMKLVRMTPFLRDGHGDADNPTPSVSSADNSLGEGAWEDGEPGEAYSDTDELAPASEVIGSEE